jgi:hypothetical protein
MIICEPGASTLYMCTDLQPQRIQTPLALLSCCVGDLVLLEAVRGCCTIRGCKPQVEVDQHAHLLLDRQAGTSDTQSMSPSACSPQRIISSRLRSTSSAKTCLLDLACQSGTGSMHAPGPAGPLLFILPGLGQHTAVWSRYASDLHRYLGSTSITDEGNRLETLRITQATVNTG